MVPWVHYIPIKEDLSDMEELIVFARENDDVARTIAQNGYDFVRESYPSMIGLVRSAAMEQMST